MSVGAILELLCYFESFRNVDLFEQGYYCVRAKISTEKNPSLLAVPLTHYNTSTPVRKIENPRHRWLPPHIADKTNTYISKAFWVQFTEEVIDINEAVHFRFESLPDIDTQVAVLELDLLFCSSDTLDSIDQMKPVSTQKYRMKDLHRGLHQFYPTVFDEWHFAVVRFAVHTSLLDFAYKPVQKSFFRFFVSAPTADNEQDRADISLFGSPCRKFLQAAHAKLSKRFQTLCTRLPEKQRINLGSDYLLPPSLVLVPPASYSASNSSPNSSPTFGRPRSGSGAAAAGGRPGTPTSSGTIPLPPWHTSGRPQTPTSASPPAAPFSPGPIASPSPSASTSSSTSAPFSPTSSATATPTISSSTTGTSNTASTPASPSVLKSSTASEDDLVVSSARARSPVPLLILTTPSRRASAPSAFTGDFRSLDKTTAPPDTIFSPHGTPSSSPYRPANNAPAPFGTPGSLARGGADGAHGGENSTNPPTSPSLSVRTTERRIIADDANALQNGDHSPLNASTGSSDDELDKSSDKKTDTNNNNSTDDAVTRNGANVTTSNDQRCTSPADGTAASPPPLETGNATSATSADQKSNSDPIKRASPIPRIAIPTSASAPVSPAPTNDGPVPPLQPTPPPPSNVPPSEPKLVNTLFSNALSSSSTASSGGSSGGTPRALTSPRTASVLSSPRKNFSPRFFNAAHPPKSLSSLTSAGALSTSSDEHKSLSKLSIKSSQIPLACTNKPARGGKPQIKPKLRSVCSPLMQPDPNDEDVRAVEILNQIHFFGDQIFDLWIRFTKVFYLVGKEDTFRIAQKYEQKHLKLFKESVFHEVAHISGVYQLLALQADPVRHRQMVASIRNSDYYKKLKSARFELVIPRLELTGQPIILEQCITISLRSSSDDGIRLTEADVEVRLIDVLSPTPLPDGATTPPPVGSPPAPSSPTAPSPVTPPPARVPKYSFSSAPKIFQGSHLYIMVHGLAGNPWDMRLFRNQIALSFPESEFLLCTCVEQNTLGDIQEMGNSVAKEIVEYLTTTKLHIGKISFVGHSLGGLIIRAALSDPLLEPYVDKFYTFVSLSVPHIGTLYNYSTLIPGAMWVWQKWSNSSCLLQLRLMDNQDATKCYLYKLSQQKGLSYFQNVLLVSSEQDLYVPFHSARIEICKEALLDSTRNVTQTSAVKSKGNAGAGVGEKAEKEAALVAMVQNIWSGVLDEWAAKATYGEIVRYDVVFESHRGMDGIIGRSAHIRLLDNPKVMQMLITTNAKFFS